MGRLEDELWPGSLVIKLKLYMDSRESPKLLAGYCGFSARTLSIILLSSESFCTVSFH